ncbi:MAG: molybdopterin-dependent oxidoreductase [Firmicutes bacterium]|nr:molybdopterin-dependent oxidoreductase [Bacillota bacterium]
MSDKHEPAVPAAEENTQEEIKQEENKQGKVSRRSFIQGAAALGAAAATLPVLSEHDRSPFASWFTDTPHGVGNVNEDYDATDVIYSVCEQCNTFCSIKTVIAKPGRTGATSIVRKIAGNPYSPLNTQPFGQIPYDTPAAAGAKGHGSVAVDGRGFRGGRTCLKGQAGIQTAFDTYRIQAPLKRVGPRGSGKWQSISWEQAIREIVEGAGDLGTPGLRQFWAYAPQEPVMADWDKVKAKEMSQEEFDAKYNDVLIDTRHPDLGPKSNQLVAIDGDRSDFTDRIIHQSFGSVNHFNHGGICGVNGVVANVRSHEGKQKKRMYADLTHTDYLIVWGTNPVVANKGPTWLAPVLTNALQRGMKMVVIDPRLSKTAEKAHLWVPVKPGFDAALALAIGRWIVENKRYDERYLTNPGPKAAKAGGEPTWSDAAHLVNLSDPKRPKLRAKDLGIGTDKQYALLENGRPVPHDQAGKGDLEVDATLNGMKVKSAFTLYKERVMEKSLQEYADLCGVDVRTIEQIARDFTSHGKRAVVMSYRGAAMHANGFYALRAINALNFLIGNHDWKGGELSAGARFAELTGRYDLTKAPGGHKPWGVPITREKAVYEKSSLFQRDGYPAKRPWNVVGGNLSHEVLPSAADAYPYSIGALFLSRVSPVVSAPNGEVQAKIMQDTKAVPMLVAFDVAIGDSSQYADYILPDQTYLERFGLQVIYPNQPLRVSTIMQPVTRVLKGPRPTEDVWIDMVKAMGLSGAGKNAFPGGASLDRASDYYLKVVANVAFDGTPVPDASPEELRIFEEARRKALARAFDPKAWQAAVKPEEWAKVVYVLNRGGRFEPPGKEYEGEWIKYRFGGQCNFYDEVVAHTKNSYDGKFLDGLPRFEPIKFYNGKPVADELPLQMINWKSRNLGTHRNISDAWLREIRPSNLLWINPRDAGPRGLKSGDLARVRTADGFEAKAEVMVTGAIRPGVVGAGFSFGHTAYGSSPVEIDGRVIKPAKDYGHTSYNLAPPLHEEAGLAGTRSTGFNVNTVQRLDEALRNAGLLDEVVGGSSQYDTRVEIEKI